MTPRQIQRILWLPAAPLIQRWFPHDNIAMSGSGSNRTMAITPVSNQNGATTITIMVTIPTERRPAVRSC